MPAEFSPTQRTSSETMPGQGCLGSVALFVGIGVFCLATVEEALPFPLPRTWYVNRALWFLLALAGIGFGCVLLRGGRMARQPVFQSVILYTRGGCHLCDEAHALLLKYADRLPPITEIDIDSDPELAERYGTVVPVVQIDGRERFRQRVNEVLLRRLIERRTPSEEA